jgi:hypothetical protein
MALLSLLLKSGKGTTRHEDNTQPRELKQPGCNQSNGGSKTVSLDFEQTCRNIAQTRRFFELETSTWQYVVSHRLFNLVFGQLPIGLFGVGLIVTGDTSVACTGNKFCPNRESI